MPKLALTDLRRIAVPLAGLTMAAGGCEDTSAPPPPAAEVRLADSSATLVPGDTLTIAAQLLDADGSPLAGSRLRWASSDTTIARVSAAGFVTARADGEAWIYAASEAVADSLALRVVDPLVADQIVARGGSTCALAGGQAWCWGVNWDHQLGTGFLDGWLRRPTPVAGGHTWNSIALGGDYGCGLTTSGARYCWGRNDESQLGDGSYTDRAFPVPFTQVDSLTAFALGGHGNCGIRAGNQLVCWEYESSSTLFAADHADVGAFHGCAWLSDGPATCWGLNHAGQLGDGTTTYSGLGTPVTGGLSFRTLATGGDFTCGLTTAGMAHCWGANDVGQLGDGTTAARLVPTPVTGVPALTAIVTGQSHACGVSAQGEAWCWGYNYSGQLGDGSTTDRATPVPVAGGRRFAMLAAGGSHTCGLTSDGQAFCWGANFSGFLGDDTRIDRPTPTPVRKP